jgi:ubiquinone/menaquinone biosynthesis C-methylase UbiE
MTWLDLPRVPEPEVMDASSEVQAYSSAAAEAYLSRIDDTFVEHALRLIGHAPGWGIDIGCGPGQILMKLARRLPQWKFIGVDRAPAMIRHATDAAGSHAARKRVSSAAAARKNVWYVAGNGAALPFNDASFDLVVCNSVLHHIGDPARFFSEIRRIAKPEAAILLRDLRRPSRLLFHLHVRWHGRHYGGLMYKLYCDSVHAAYTVEELSAMLRMAGILGARLFTLGSTHLGIERPAAAD